MALVGKQHRISPFIRSTIESAVKEMDSNTETLVTEKPLEIQGTDSVEAIESPLISFVLPLFKFLRYIFFTHSLFEFDKINGEFRHIPGSILRKSICCIVQILSLAFVFMEVKYVMALTGAKAITVMYKFMGIAYLAFNISFYLAIMTQGDTLVEIFNLIQNTTIVVRKAGCRIPRRKIVLWIALGMLCFYVLHATGYVLLNVDGVGGAALGNGPADYFKAVVDYNTNRVQIAFNSQNISDPTTSTFSRDNSTSIVVVLGLLCWLFCLTASLTWSIAFLMVTMWGLLFWKVLFNFFAIIGQSSVRNTLEDIRSYNAITGIVDMFNHAFGWVILTGVFSGIAHFSVFSVELFKEGQDIWIQVLIATSFLLYGLQLLSSAQVNQSAANIVETIKLRYQLEPVWREYHGHCMETTQGLVLVFHETQSNKIGFRGLGFFTITYSFIGTVLSIISTYAVVAMQLQH